MKLIDKNKKIILDADVIIHFFKAGHLGLLTQIYPNKLYLVKDVLTEVFKGKLRIEIENSIRMKFIEELDFSSDIKVISEYARLKKKYGPGESACMAYCKFNNDVLASSNLKDIKRYCEENDIQYLTTLDFLNTAYEKGLLTESDCDYFIYNVKSKGSKLPVDSIKEFRKL
ncbi:MAG: hypothetical protein PF481_06345 [Bacteroidales bacterium]|nr:hypothetical protein [Bacteroidales bacterium]